MKITNIVAPGFCFCASLFGIAQEGKVNKYALKEICTLPLYDEYVLSMEKREIVDCIEQLKEHRFLIESRLAEFEKINSKKFYLRKSDT